MTASLPSPHQGSCSVELVCITVCIRVYYCVLECITVYCRVYFSVLLLHSSGGWCPVELALVNLFRYTLPASSCCSSLNGWFAADDQLEFCILLRRIDTTSTIYQRQSGFSPFDIETLCSLSHTMTLRAPISGHKKNLIKLCTNCTNCSLVTTIAAGHNKTRCSSWSQQGQHSKQKPATGSFNHPTNTNCPNILLL